MHEVRDVRVTARKSIGRDFIAPELSPVHTVDLELEKGIPGWTDKDVKIADNTQVDGGKDAFLLAEHEAITVGSFIPKVTVRREVAHKRPTTRRWS